MAVGSTSRPLLVPAADVLAKNMRALDAARIPPAAAASEAGGAPAGKRRTLIGLGVATEESQREARTQIRFRKAADDAPPGPMAALLAKIFPKKLTEEEKAAEEERRKTEKTGLEKAFAKLLPILEKAAALASRLPDPTVLFLGLVLAVLLVERVRPQWLKPVLVKLGVISSFLPLFALALLWKKTELFATLREGQNPLSHPAEHTMDDLEAELTQREERVKVAEETLKKNRAQLDALRKELAKDPQARDPDAVLVPSRKAAAMIAAGALGAGYDAEAAAAVEQRRRKESVKKSREEWRLRMEQEGVEQTKDSLKLLVDHANTAYTKRTREVKARTNAGSGKSSERLMSLRKVVGGGSPAGGAGSDELQRRVSRQSDSAASLNSAASKKRFGVFRRKRKEDRGIEGDEGDEHGLEPSPSSSALQE